MKAMAAGATIPLVGCLGDDDGDTPTDGGNGNGNGNMTDTATPTPSPTPEPGELESRVGGDLITFSTTPLSEVYLPEQDDDNSANRTSLLSDPTYALDTSNEVVPMLMDMSVDDTSNNDVYVCNLRDNIQYGADFGQMTADDVVYQLEFVDGVADSLEDRQNGEYPTAAGEWNEETPPSSALQDFNVVENVEKTGNLQVQIELAEPDPRFQLRSVMWGHDILPQALYEKYAPDAQALRESDEVTGFTWQGNLGPYDFEDRTPGVTGSFTATRSDSYYMRDHVEDSNVVAMADLDSEDAGGQFWEFSPYFDTYQYDVEQENAVYIGRFKAGEGDVGALPTKYVEEFRQAVDDVRVEEAQTPFIEFVFFNQRSNGSPLTRSKTGRKAISEVINKTVITEQIDRGLAEPAVTHHPTWGPLYDEEAVTQWGIDVTDEDRQNARDRLRNDSDFILEDNDGFELFGPDDNRITLELFVDAGDDRDQDVAAQVKEDLATIGAAANVNTRSQILGEDFFSEPLPDADPSTFEYGPVGRNAGPPDKTRTVADWDLLFGVAANSYPRAPADTEVFWVKDSAVNAYGYVPETAEDESSNAELFSQFRNATDEGTRQELFNQIQGRLTDDVPALFLTQGQDFIGVGEDVVTPPNYGDFGNTLFSYRGYKET